MDVPIKTVLPGDGLVVQLAPRVLARYVLFSGSNQANRRKLMRESALLSSTGRVGMTELADVYTDQPTSQFRAGATVRAVVIAHDAATYAFDGHTAVRAGLRGTRG